MADFSDREAPYVADLLYDNPSKAAQRLSEDLQMVQSPREAANLLRQVTEQQDPQGASTVVIGRPQPTDGVCGSATTDVIVQSYDQNTRQPVQDVVARLESAVPCQDQTQLLPPGTTEIPGLPLAIGADGSLQTLQPGMQDYPPGYVPGYGYDQSQYPPGYGYDYGYVDPLAALSGLFIVGAAGYGISRWGDQNWLYQQQQFSNLYRTQAMNSNPGQMYGNQRIVMPATTYNSQVAQPFHQSMAQSSTGSTLNNFTPQSIQSTTGSRFGSNDFRYTKTPNSTSSNSGLGAEQGGSLRPARPGQIAQPGSSTAWPPAGRETSNPAWNGTTGTGVIRNPGLQQTNPGRQGTEPIARPGTIPQPNQGVGSDRHFGNGTTLPSGDNRLPTPAPVQGDPRRQFGGAPQVDHRFDRPPAQGGPGAPAQREVAPAPAPQKQYHQEVQRTPAPVAAPARPAAAPHVEVHAPPPPPPRPAAVPHVEVHPPAAKPAPPPPVPTPQKH